MTPFIGRHRELNALTRDLASTSVVSLFGALGSGKSRLVTELARVLGAPCTLVECLPGDRASAVRSRAAHALRCVPGSVAQTLTQQARVLVIDDIQSLRTHEITSLLAQLLLGPTALGRVVVVSRDPLAAVVGSTIAQIEVHGLDAESGSQLWSHLEKCYGEAQGVAAALARTRRLPLALRREYARARFGASAWDVAALDAPARATLEALAILRTPVAPAAVAALSSSIDTETALPSLLARQLVDELGDGRIVVHDVVRANVLAHMALDDRSRLSAAAAQLVASAADGSPGPRSAWQSGDDGTFGAVDRIIRVREVVWHWLGAGRRDRAADALLADRELVTRGGGAGEFESLLDALDDQPRRRTERAITDGGDLPEDRVDCAPLDPERTQALAAVRIEIAVRGGRYAEAFERARVAPGAVAPLLHVELTLASGDAATARRALTGLIAVEDPSQRARAVAMLAELELLAGKPDAAAAHLMLLGDLSAADPVARARAHVAAARLDEYEGRVGAMRSALARAHGACKSVPTSIESTELSAIVDARRAIGLTREGRLVEAVTALHAAEVGARGLNAIAVADEVLTARVLVARRRGETALAARLLQDVMRARRELGDELGALRAELEIAELEIARGQPALAAELASAVLMSSLQCELGHLAARSRAVVAAIDLFELRLDAALPRLEELNGQAALDAGSAAQVAVLLATARALSGQRIGAIEQAQNAGAESRDEIDRRLAAAEVALAAGDVGIALKVARDTAVLAERAHRTIELASALVIVARLEMACGDRGNARAAASRAAIEAASAGLVRVRIHALLALCALARADNDVSFAVDCAHDAAELAVAAGLPVERLVANAVLHTDARYDAVADPAAPSAATMTPMALRCAERLLVDFGLTAQRPFRVVDAEGVPTDIADADPGMLGLSTRTLAVDGVREVIWRHGCEIADLRRRSLLKHMLFLFASAPGKSLSKESIVEAVWNVEYHPLRHDAALFTSVMRLRRLLGEDGSELVRGVGDGYRFMPPSDFLFVVLRSEAPQ